MTMSALGNLPTPQQARAVATRTRILDATVACLTAHGVGGATTTVIARHAGVSQGALYKHFPAKHLLMGAATEHLFAAMREDFPEQLADAIRHSEEPAVSVGFDVLWQTYNDPRLKGVFELYLAARTDPALHDVLQPIVEQHFDALLVIARAVFPDGAKRNPRFDDAVLTILLAMHGAALMATVMPGNTSGPRLQKSLIERLAQDELGTPSLEVLSWKKP